MSSETLSSFGGPGGGGGSEAWRLIDAVGPTSSDLAASERAPDLQRAIGQNLRVLSALFNAVNASLGGDSSPSGSSWASGH